MGPPTRVSHRNPPHFEEADVKGGTGVYNPEKYVRTGRLALPARLQPLYGHVAKKLESGGTAQQTATDRDEV